MDKERIAQLQGYVELLAKGIDPFTGEVASEGDVLNNVSVTRCLFEVNDLLKEVIRELPRIGRRKRHPFVYDEALSAKIEIKKHPITLSQLVRNIVAVYGRENRVTYYDLLPLLVERGYLRENPEGNPKYIAAEGAEQYGVLMDRIATARGVGMRWVTLYNEVGQRMVIDLLRELKRK